ncbi:MAG: hypothetical protein LBU70_02010 [Chitinispirillales bacterium]|jgi:hypothetical protein|nr:hypothetical protein [Chitinispirillales bacterium]
MKNRFTTIAILFTMCAAVFLSCGESESKNYRLLIDATEGGNVDLNPKSSDGLFPRGTPITVTATPYAGHILESIRVAGGETVRNANAITIVMDDNMTVFVTFREGEGDKNIPVNTINWTNPYSRDPDIFYFGWFDGRARANSDRHLVLDNIHTGQIWDWQVYQPGFRYNEGDYFRVRVRARVEGNPRQFEIGIQMHGHPFTTYAGSFHYMYEVTSNVATNFDVCVRPLPYTATDHNAKFFISAGSTSAAAGTLIIEEIHVMPSNEQECGSGSVGGITPNWTNPFSQMPVVNSGSHSEYVKFGANGDITLTSRNGPGDVWHVQIGQDGFNYNPATNYVVNMSGTVTGTARFEMMIAKATPNYQAYTWNDITLPNGPFTREIALHTVPEAVVDPDARITINFNYPNNGTMVISNFVVSAAPSDNWQPNHSCLTGGVCSAINSQADWNACPDANRVHNSVCPVPPPPGLWINPYSSVQPTAQGDLANNVTITSDAITVRGVVATNVWDIQIIQPGFDYSRIGNTSPNAATDYAVTITGTVTGAPMIFETIVQLFGAPYTMYLWGMPPTPIPVGPFTRTINLRTTDNPGFNVPNPNAMFAFNFGISANAGGTMTITNVTITGP